MYNVFKGLILLVVYADILIVLNLIVNYFLLLGSAIVLRRKIKIFRGLLGSLAGAIASLYIFLPQMSVAAELAYKIVLCLLMTLIVFGIRSTRQYIKAAVVFFVVSCGYAGVMIAVWHIFKPNGMAINNSIIYFNISPMVLILCSVAVYAVFSISFKLFGRTAIDARDCEIRITVGERQTEFRAIIDTGNSVSDIFGKSEIIIADESVVCDLFVERNIDTDIRYRAIPFNTVSGCGILEGYRCDSGVVKSGKKTVLLKKPILALSKTPIREGYYGIVNPKILD